MRLQTYLNAWGRLKTCLGMEPALITSTCLPKSIRRGPRPSDCGGIWRHTKTVFWACSSSRNHQHGMPAVLAKVGRCAAITRLASRVLPALSHHDQRYVLVAGIILEIFHLVGSALQNLCGFRDFLKLQYVVTLYAMPSLCARSIDGGCRVAWLNDIDAIDSRAFGRQRNLLPPLPLMHVLKNRSASSMWRSVLAQQPH